MTAAKYTWRLFAISVLSGILYLLGLRERFPWWEGGLSSAFPGVRLGLPRALGLKSRLRWPVADSWELAEAESRLGVRLAAGGRLEEARVCLRESYETLRRLRGKRSLLARQAWERYELWHHEAP